MRRLFAGASGGGDSLARFRCLYCLALAGVTIHELSLVPGRYAKHLAVYAPIQLLRRLGPAPPPQGVVWAAGGALIAALVLAALGVRARAMLVAALLLFLGVYGVFEGWLRPYPTAVRVALYHSLHPPVLLALSCAPGIDRVRLGLHPLRVVREQGSPPPRWPLIGVELSLGTAYFGSFYAKLRDTGWSWADGFNLQTYLLEKYSINPRLKSGLWLAQHHDLCLLLSVGSLALEALFWTVTLWPARSRLRWLYVAGGLGFHVLTGITLGIWEFLTSYCAVYLVFLARLREPRLGRPNLDWRTAWRATALPVVLLVAIFGRINWWPLCDFGAFSERSDWRTETDVTRCEVLEPGQPGHGCFGRIATLGRPVQLTLGAGETPTQAARRYAATLKPAGGGARQRSVTLRMTLRDYVTVNGWLQPRYSSVDIPW